MLAFVPFSAPAGRIAIRFASLSTSAVSWFGFVRPVHPAVLLCLRGVDVSHGEDVFGGMAGSDELSKVQGAAVAVDDAAADFESADAA